jgi:hypothetical protein
LIETDLIETDLIETDLIETDLIETDLIETDLIETDLIETEAKPQTNIKEVKYKQSIPVNLKLLVWDYWIGLYVGKTKCLCCNMVDIMQGSFECGHIISRSNGGDMSVTNLKPICKTCNSSMNTQNMDDFMKQWNLKIIKPVGIKESDNSINKKKPTKKTPNKENKYICDNDTNEKKMQCECGKTFSCRQNLWRHRNKCNEIPHLNTTMITIDERELNRLKQTIDALTTALILLKQEKK